MKFIYLSAFLFSIWGYTNCAERKTSPIMCVTETCDLSGKNAVISYGGKDFGRILKINRIRTPNLLAYTAILVIENSEYAYFSTSLNTVIFNKTLNMPVGPVPFDQAILIYKKFETIFNNNF